jgi:hypothetical protein
VTQRRTLILRGRGFGSDTRVDLFEPGAVTPIERSSFTMRLIDDEQITVDITAETLIGKIRVTNDDGSTDEVELERPPAATLALTSVRIEAAEVATKLGEVKRRQKLTLLGSGFRETTSVTLTSKAGASPPQILEKVLLSDRRLEVLASDGEVSIVQVKNVRDNSTDELILTRPDPESPGVSLRMASLSDPAWIAYDLPEGKLGQLLTLVGDQFDSGTQVTVTHPPSEDSVPLLGAAVTDEHTLVVVVAPEEDLPFRITVQNPSDKSSDELILGSPPDDRSGSDEPSEGS